MYPYKTGKYYEFFSTPSASNNYAPTLSQTQINDGSYVISVPFNWQSGTQYTFVLSSAGVGSNTYYATAPSTPTTTLQPTVTPQPTPTQPQILKVEFTTQQGIIIVTSIPDYDTAIIVINGNITINYPLCENPNYMALGINWQSGITYNFQIFYWQIGSQYGAENKQTLTYTATAPTPTTTAIAPTPIPLVPKIISVSFPQSSSGNYILVTFSDSVYIINVTVNGVKSSLSSSYYSGNNWLQAISYNWQSGESYTITVTTSNGIDSTNVNQILSITATAP